MKILTISREFGSGGRELGQQLANILGFDYYDKEIIISIARNKGLDEVYVRESLENQGWRNIPLTFRHSFTGVAIYSVQIELLLEQKRVIDQIAKMEKDCVIVGRNADVLLEEYQPFKIFVCATKEAKIRRCMERVPYEEKLSTKEVERMIRQIDKNRAQTRDIISGSPWGQRDAYQLIVNTSTWNIKELTPAVAAVAERWFERIYQ